MTTTVLLKMNVHTERPALTGQAWMPVHLITKKSPWTPSNLSLPGTGGVYFVHT